MWRSWVDRLNTTTADSEETTKPLYEAEKELGPSELQQRQVNQKELLELCSKVYAQSNSADDNVKRHYYCLVFYDCFETKTVDPSLQGTTAVLTSEILPKFVKLHEKYIDDIEKSVGDSRNLAAIITKSFITGIRRVPEALGRLRTSLNLLTQIQSKSHLYYHAAALGILAKEMASYIMHC
ncbi:hypothetical protein NQZ79_g5614 [Umbelopsis isabellina]|nr:hypothetical protein NQZ79_g5614 [Umbelopsis isabellina]